MNKMKYESPNFDFNELKLTETIAKKCWGYGWAWVDHDLDPDTYPVRYDWIDGDSGCGGNDDGARVTEIINRFPYLEGKITTDDVLVNTSDTNGPLYDGGDFNPIPTPGS